MKTCTTCSRSFPDAEVRQTAQGLLCAECALDLPGAGKTPLPISGVGIAAAVCAFVPFGAHYTSSSSVTINGEVTQSVYRDYVAIGGGALGLALGAVALIGTLKATDQKALRSGIAGTIVFMAVIQLLRGFGII